MARNKSEDTTHVESAPFTLELPEEINVEPTFTVQLSPTRKALIYRYSYIEEGVARMRYAARIVYAKTGITSPRDYYNSTTSFDQMFEVKQYLIDVSAQLNIKKKTRKTITVEEPSEDEE